MTIDKMTTSGEQLPLGWEISFSPHINFLHNSKKDPIQILAELASLGELIVDADTSLLPLFSELEPDKCYLSWQLTLNGNVAKDDVEKIFASVVQYCDLRIKPLSTGVAQQTQTTNQPQLELAQSQNKEVEALLEVSEAKLDHLTRLMNQMFIKQGKVRQQLNEQGMSQTNDEIVGLESSAREMQEAVMQLRFLPIGSIFNGLTEFVSELANNCSKKVEFKLSGEKIELDGAAIEIIDESLRLLLQDCMQNSLEIADVRLASAKSSTASLKLAVYKSNTNIIIEISDDGIGEIEDLTDLDAVRDKIATLGGSFDVESQIGEKTTYTIQLPINLGVLDGQLVRAAGETYILPVSLMVESLAINLNEISDIAGKGELYSWQGEYIPIIHLDQLVAVKRTITELEEGLLVVVNIDKQKIGLLLDEVLEQQRIFSQNLATNYKNIKGVSAAAIMTDATVALILDLPNLIELYRNSASTHIESTDSDSKVA